MQTNKAVVALNDAFKMEAPGIMQSLKDAAADNDTIEVIKHAHALAGAARRMQATTLQNFCNGIEKLARGGDIATVQKDLSEIQDLYHDALEQANKTSTDQRMERVEDALINLAVKIESLVEANKESNQRMVDALLGKKQVPEETMRFVTRLLGAIILAFVAIFGFMLTGSKKGWLDIFGATTHP